MPEAAGRSLWLSALWTGVGTALVCAIIAIVAVAVFWLPASGGSTGRTTSALHAGLLTFLASVHGGITVGGVSAHWLPLGMLLAVAATAWRAGSGLADAAADLDETDPVRLGVAGLVQAVSFMIATVLVVPFAGLGSSDAPILGVGAGAFLTFVLAGGTSFVRSSPLGSLVVDALPAEVVLAVRAGSAALTCYLGFGAILVAGSLIVHHAAAEQLSRQVGGGWGGVPILALGVLAAPNAAIYGASYLAGPGFALGTGTGVSMTSTAHGTLPAFPLLAAVPGAHGANPAVWALAAAAIIAAGLSAARLARRTGSVAGSLRVSGYAAGAAAVVMMVLGWQAGGSIGSARLRAVGPSPWQFGLSVGVEVAVVSMISIGAVALIRVFGGGHRELVAMPDEDFQAARTTALSIVEPAADATADTTPEDEELAG